MSDESPFSGFIEGVPEPVGEPEAKAPEVSEDKAAVEGVQDEKQPDDTLELTPDDEIVPEDGEEKDSDEHKRRSKPASQRIAEMRWKLGEAERRIAELEGKAPQEQTEAPEAPDPSKYEFGMADPQYLLDMVRHDAAQERAKERVTTEQQQGRNALVSRLQDGLSAAETKGAEKYEDFAEKIASAVEARGGEPMPPLVSVGIAVSPVGADITYRLATDQEMSDKIEALAKQSPQATAQALGELEGEYLPADSDDSDLDMADQLDMARMLGRMRARLRGKSAAAPKVTPTEAPEPPKERLRGSGGHYAASGDTTDFPAFERQAMGRK